MTHLYVLILKWRSKLQWCFKKKTPSKTSILWESSVLCNLFECCLASLLWLIWPHFNFDFVFTRWACDGSTLSVRLRRLASAKVCRSTPLKITHSLWLNYCVNSRHAHTANLWANTLLHGDALQIENLWKSATMLNKYKAHINQHLSGLQN